MSQISQPQTTADDKPLGQRFSHTYLDRGVPGSDSARLRIRLASYFKALQGSTKLDFAESIHQELGVKVPYVYAHDYSAFIEKCELRDLLDFVTLVCRELMKRADVYRSHGEKRDEWVEFVNRAFAEENVGYRADHLGGMHYYVDEEFERNRASAVTALQRPRYLAALTEVRATFVALDRTPLDGAGAIRCVFHASEIVFKLLCERAGKNNVARLGSGEISNLLPSIITQIYATNVTAINSSKLLTSSFAKWVDSAHLYRHGQKTETPAPPPPDLAIAMVSTGLTMLRWLAELDHQLPAQTE